MQRFREVDARDGASPSSTRPLTYGPQSVPPNLNSMTTCDLARERGSRAPPRCRSPPRACRPLQEDRDDEEEPWGDEGGDLGGHGRSCGGGPREVHRWPRPLPRTVSGGNVPDVREDRPLDGGPIPLPRVLEEGEPSLDPREVGAPSGARPEPPRTRNEISRRLRERAPGAAAFRRSRAVT